MCFPDPATVSEAPGPRRHRWPCFRRESGFPLSDSLRWRPARPPGGRTRKSIRFECLKNIREKRRPGRTSGYHSHRNGCWRNRVSRYQGTGGCRQDSCSGSLRQRAMYKRRSLPFGVIRRVPRDSTQARSALRQGRHMRRPGRAHARPRRTQTGLPFRRSPIRRSRPPVERW